FRYHATERFFAKSPPDDGIRRFRYGLKPYLHERNIQFFQFPEGFRGAYLVTDGNLIPERIRCQKRYDFLDPIDIRRKKTVVVEIHGLESVTGKFSEIRRDGFEGDLANFGVFYSSVTIRTTVFATPSRR
ncbi:MAG: hypothetical protein QG650_772, partial [Patescibacteria group bacterium]|nr:hypothetical protein [Patescibacteria group bacterium]